MRISHRTFGKLENFIIVYSWRAVNQKILRLVEPCARFYVDDAAGIRIDILAASEEPHIRWTLKCQCTAVLDSKIT